MADYVFYNSLNVAEIKLQYLLNEGWIDFLSLFPETEKQNEKEKYDRRHPDVI
jgi:hypothetical protein